MCRMLLEWVLPGSTFAQTKFVLHARACGLGRLAFLRKLLTQKESVAAKVCCTHVQVVAMISGSGIRATSDNLGEFTSLVSVSAANPLRQVGTCGFVLLFHQRNVENVVVSRCGDSSGIKKRACWEGFV